MIVWDTYPEDYRAKEVRAVRAAVQAGECVSLVGLSGAGKSNLVNFLFHRCGGGARPEFALADGNRAHPATAAALLRLARQSVAGPLEQGLQPLADEAALLEAALGQRFSSRPGSGLCLLFDRYDALNAEEQAAAAGPLRALRDAYKYQLTYVVATRRPPDNSSELAELFYAHTIWLGGLSKEDAFWSAGQFAARHDLAWDEAVLDALFQVSRGYPSLLRACCEACAGGTPPDAVSMREHSAVQRRVQEFWAASPSMEDLRSSGLLDHPLLGAAPRVVDAASPDLTASEHRLLAHFQAHAGQVCEKDDLIRAVWPEDRVLDGLRDDSLAQLIRRLRQKIGADRIQTIPGRGYRFVA